MIVNKIHEFTGHRDCIYTAVIDEPRKTLFTAGGDGMAVAWDLEKGGDGIMQVNAGMAIYSIGLLNHSKLLLGSHKGNLFLVDLEEKKEERNIEAHTGGIFDIIHDKENGRILTVGFDGILNAWDENLNLMKTIRISEKSLRCVLIMGDEIAVASSDHGIYLLDSKTLALKQKIEGHRNSVFALAWNPARNELLSGGRDCYVRIWDLQHHHLTDEYVGATLHINAISFDPDYRVYSVSSMDKTIKIFDAHTHKPVKFIDKQKNNGHTSSVNKALWIRADMLASVSDDKKAMVWELT